MSTNPSRFKLRKGLKIGDLAAENDKLLDRVFFDQGHLEALTDTEDARFLVLGRTGSGKTALMQQIKSRCEHVSVLNPEELSMRYLHSSVVLRELTAWGVNLEVFYKFLWRHICVLEIIRMRYGDSTEVPSLIQQAIALVSTAKRDENVAKETALNYLRNYGEQYWVTTDTRIKKIVEEVELKAKSDHSVGACLGALNLQIGGRASAEAGSRTRQTVEKDVVDRAQNIVTDYLIPDLGRVISLLGKAGFNDSQKRSYLLIDDLDKNWMPDDALYLELTKSLLQTVYDLNRTSPLKGVKIIVALRENIYHRVFQKAAIHEPQREKWLDVQIRLRWSKSDLEEMVDKRLAELYRGQYTQATPALRDFLPVPKKRTGEDPLDFILDRTFMRPRDLIDFLNTAIADAGAVTRLTWDNLTRAETEYSKRRRQSLFDEWKDSYFGLPLFFPLLAKFGAKFTYTQMSDEHIQTILNNAQCEQCRWLDGIQGQFCENEIDMPHIRVEFLKALYLIGMIGVKQPHSHHILYSSDQPFDSNPEVLSNASFHVHKMFWSSLGISGSP